MATRQREKTQKLEQTRDRRPTCIAKYIRIPSGKVEIVLDLIRGKSYDEAATILHHTNKSASPVILKVLNSAAANAENNLNMSKDNLYVAECYATSGPTLKRLMVRARGRADRLLKRTCHVRVTLGEREIKNAAPKVKKPVAAKVTAKDVKSENKEVTVKKEVKTPATAVAKATASKPAAAKPVTSKPATAVKPADATAKAVAKPAPKQTPVTVAERPLTDKPNEKKPLGTKKTEQKEAK